MDERRLLAQLGREPIAAGALGERLGLPETLVSELIQRLRQAGLEIGGGTAGYHLQAGVELLDPEAIVPALAPEARAVLSGLEVVWQVDSTNSCLLARPAPEQGTLALLAESQGQGRGRRGRSWVSPVAANLYLSLLRGFVGGLQRTGGLSLVMGVAAAEALQGLGFTRVGVKWPNDLVVDGNKLGGLLVEGGGEFAGPAKVVVGLGLNVSMPRSAGGGITQSYTDLATLAGGSVSRNRVAAAVLEHLLIALETFEHDGLTAFLDRYASLDVLAGREVMIEEGGAIHAGIAEGLADDGALCVVVGGRRRHFHAGEVSVRAR